MKLTSLLRFVVFTFAASTCFGTAQSKGEPAVSYCITGTLVSSADGAPIPHGHLTATLVHQRDDGGSQFPAPFGTFDADEHGQFSMVLPSTGMWRVVGGARGYVTQAYDEHEFFSSGIRLTAASPVIDLRFQLSPEAVITGSVIDEAGEAVRNARVTLLEIPAPGPDSSQPVARTHAGTSTDDRGSYEFDDLQPGDYRIRVQAQVWYAMAAQQTGFGAETNRLPLDPSLDVTYPLTWYPGTSNPSEAETLTIHAGESRQADFQLMPIPSVHLHILPETSVDANGRRMQTYPMIERISSDGNDFVPVSARLGPQGAIDVGGLAPGRYEVRMQGPGQAIKPALVEVAEGSAQTLDMNAASAMASITIQLDGIAKADTSSVQVNLIDSESGRNAAQDDAGAYFLSGTLLNQRRSNASRVIEVPPGRYEVVLTGRPNLYLTGMTAQSGMATKRFITAPSGHSTLTLHIAEGRSTLTGIAMMQGKPSVGAMVLLIPATLGEPDSLDIIRRDQTNTDGSFDLVNVLPGKYILLAIDHGWQVNWKASGTLRGQMMHGVSVDLTSTQKMKETIEAQAP